MSNFVFNEKEKDELRQLFPKFLISHIKTDVEYYMCVPYGKKYSNILFYIFSFYRIK